MNGTRLMHICGGALLLWAVACRSQVQSLPSETADLMGQVVEVRRVGGSAGGGEMQRLRVRVSGSRTTAPGTDAYVGVDGITVLMRGDARGDSGEHPELEGAFVRVWFRGPPRTATPIELSAMARVLAIDSLASPGIRQ